MKKKSFDILHPWQEPYKACSVEECSGTTSGDARRDLAGDKPRIRLTDTMPGITGNAVSEGCVLW